jgi:hypothetical protein
MLIGTVLSVVSPASAVPLFTQCPPIGFSDGCSILFTFEANGSVTSATDAAIPAYDGVEDVLVGVQNNSSSTVTSLQLSSSVDIFGFDGDGAGEPGTGCLATTGNPHPCISGGPFGGTGYEGPGTSFGNISTDEKSGTVNFSLTPGQHAWFSLEGSPSNIMSGGGIIPGGGTAPGPGTAAVPEPGTIGLVLTGLGGLLLYRRRGLRNNEGRD